MGMSATQASLRTIAVDAGAFGGVLDRPVRSHLDALATRLDAIDGLTVRERGVILLAVAAMLQAVLGVRLSLVLELELGEALGEGPLLTDSLDDHRRELLDPSATDAFWRTLDVRYPTLLSRVDRLVGQRCDAAIVFARHWVTDRPLLSPLLEGRGPGELWQLSFATDESRRGGHATAVVHGEGGRLLYKPRPMAIDAALAGFLAQMRPVHTEPLAMRLPASMGFAEHGWSAHVTPRVAEDDEAWRAFHRGLGQWLALTRLFGGSDLRPDNLVACGGPCYVIDCETLFAPRRTRATDDFAATVALATRQLDGAMLTRFSADLLDAFDAMAETLHVLDGAGALRPMMGGFDPCRIRVVARATEVYAELEQMLWHPASLRDERATRERAHAHLHAMAAQSGNAPASAPVIAAEIDELLDGDLPLFETTPEHGRLDGPRGTRWGKVGNLVDEALLHWRHADVAQDRDIIRHRLHTMQ